MYPNDMHFQQLESRQFMSVSVTPVAAPAPADHEQSIQVDLKHRAQRQEMGPLQDHSASRMTDARKVKKASDRQAQALINALTSGQGIWVEPGTLGVRMIYKFRREVYNGGLRSGQRTVLAGPIRGYDTPTQFAWIARGNQIHMQFQQGTRETLTFAGASGNTIFFRSNSGFTYRFIKYA